MSRVSGINGMSAWRNLNYIVLSFSEVAAPKMTSNSDFTNSTMFVNLTHELEMICTGVGSPEPDTTWYKDGDLLTPGNNINIFDDSIFIRWEETYLNIALVWY